MDSQTSPDPWQSLRFELQKQSEAIFQSTGEVVLVETSEHSEMEMALISRTKRLKLTYVPERNAVKWETMQEYGFDRISEPTAPLASVLLRRVHRR